MIYIKRYKPNFKRNNVIKHRMVADMARLLGVLNANIDSVMLGSKIREYMGPLQGAMEYLEGKMFDGFEDLSLYNDCFNGAVNNIINSIDRDAYSDFVKGMDNLIKYNRFARDIDNKDYMALVSLVDAKRAIVNGLKSDYIGQQEACKRIGEVINELTAKGDTRQAEDYKIKLGSEVEKLKIVETNYHYYLHGYGRLYNVIEYIELLLRTEDVDNVAKANKWISLLLGTINKSVESVDSILADISKDMLQRRQYLDSVGVSVDVPSAPSSEEQ